MKQAMVEARVLPDHVRHALDDWEFLAFTACDGYEKMGRVVIGIDVDKENRYFNIPIANTTVIMLGIGTETWEKERMKVQSKLMRQVNDDL